MKLIDGKSLAAGIREGIKQEIAKLNLHPKLAVILVGDDPASHIYVGLKEKAAQDVGIETDIRRLPANVSDEMLRHLVEGWNGDETVDAILIQLPLPPGHDTDALLAALDPRKDVDGFHPDNTAKLLAGSGTIFPPVHESILRLIGATDKNLRSAKVVILANSEIFAAPLEKLLHTAGCFVSVFMPPDIDRDAVREADIVVIALGRPKFLTRDMVKSGACIIDVGTNRTENGKIAGDADAENLKDLPGWLSPVPGGIGPMTVALLLRNVLILAGRHSRHHPLA